MLGVNYNYIIKKQYKFKNKFDFIYIYSFTLIQI